MTETVGLTVSVQPPEVVGWMRIDTRDVPLDGSGNGTATVKVEHSNHSYVIWFRGEKAAIKFEIKQGGTVVKKGESKVSDNNTIQVTRGYFKTV